MSATQSERFVQAIEKATGASSRPGNDFTILQNGNEIFPPMLEAIKSAQTSIEFITYVLWHSRIATEFANALCERARAGVQVRLLVDAFGGAIMNSRTFWQLERAGVKVAWFRPGRWQYLRRLNNRTHRKVLLVDGRLGFTGGVGIADQWSGAADSPKHYRETHCRITGPACADLFAAFAENWFEATRERLSLPPQASGHSTGSVSVHTTISTSGKRPTAAERLFDAIIATAKHRLLVTTAYFVPNAELITALNAAVARGVDVQILTNGPATNHRVTRWAGHTSFPALLSGGVKLFEYQGTVLHTKALIADSCFATLGSTNLDDRSLILNDEVNVSVTDPALIKQLEAQFATDLASARAVTSADWRRRRWPNRVVTSGAGLFRHQL